MAYGRFQGKSGLDWQLRLTAAFSQVETLASGCRKLCTHSGVRRGIRPESHGNPALFLFPWSRHTVLGLPNPHGTLERMYRIPTRVKFCLVRNMLAICSATLLLAGCPTPVPRCTDLYHGKPGIDVRELSPADKKVADGSVIAYGRITVLDAKDQGTISARLIRYDKPTFSSMEPYGEETIWFKPDGRFYWILPAGRYVIQPLYFNYAYSDASYSKKAMLNTSLEFTLPEEATSVFLGAMNITLSSKYELQSITINTGERLEGSELPTWSFAHDLPVSEIMMVENPGLPPLEVQRRKICRERGVVVCGLLLYGGICPRE